MVQVIGGKDFNSGIIKKVNRDYLVEVIVPNPTGDLSQVLVCEKKNGHELWKYLPEISKQYRVQSGKWGLHMNVMQVRPGARTACLGFGFVGQQVVL